MNKPHPFQPNNVNMLHEAELKASNFNNRLAVAITRYFGSVWMLYGLIAWMLVWMTLSSAGFWLFKRDPYPFIFLLFLSNLIQLWALPVLAVGGNVLNRKQELQANEEYERVQKIFADTETIITQNNEILQSVKEKQSGGVQ